MIRSLKESRRKLDVNRMLVEDTRLVLTEEIRRQEFIKNIQKNSQKIINAGSGIRTHELLRD